MLIGFIILSVALIAQTIYLLAYKKQIKHVGEQLSFISKHQSFKFIHLQLRSKEIHHLVQLCNVLLREKRELQQQFVQKNEAINETIVNLSHDIRTPLTSLGGYLQLAESTKDLSEKTRYMKLANTRMKRIVRLVDELFFYTKLQNAAYELELTSLDVNELLQKRLFSALDEFTARNEEPILDLPDLPVFVTGNVMAVERVFENLISNYLLHGSGSLTIRCEEKEDEFVLHFINILKQDQAIQPDKMFSRFYKADPSRTVHSSGLGLSIVKSLMEKMNGDVRLRTDAGQFCLSTIFTRAEKGE